MSTKEQPSVHNSEQKIYGEPVDQGIPYPNLPEMLARYEIIKPDKAHMMQLEFERNPKDFSWINMAAKDTKIGTALHSITSSPLIYPPRTAHLGGVWADIAAGAGAELTLNGVIHDKGYGHLLLFDVNQTPDNTWGKGDTLYLPGTVFEGERVQMLDLYTWDGSQLSKQDRSKPLFVPFVWADYQGSLVPLTALHRSQNEALGRYDFHYVSDVIVTHEAAVTDICVNMIKRIQLEEDRSERMRLMKRIFDRAVDLNGEVVDVAFSSNGNGTIHMGSSEYTPEEFTALALIPLKIAGNPTALADSSNLPERFPAFSKEMYVELMAVLNTDFYNGYGPARPVNPHFHWGAFQMAGAPPMYRGYFEGSDSIVKDLMTLTRIDNPNIPPVYYLLFPAAAFTLWPSEGHPEDIQAVNDFIATIHAKTDGYRATDNRMITDIQQAASDWISKYGTTVSNYFSNRFIDGPYLNRRAFPDSPVLCEPEGFSTLSFRQASIAVGALKKAYVGNI